MKTFKQYLTEAEVMELAEVLKKDCMPFLHAAQGKYLKRGIPNLDTAASFKATLLDYSGDPIDVYKKEVRKDRRPRDTNKQYHELVDHWFKEAFGVRVRSESMFCAGMAASDLSLRQYAGNSGKVCMVFPKGNFKFVWSPDVADLTEKIEDVQAKIENDEEDNGIEVTEQEKYEMVSDLLERAGYRDTDFDKALQHRNEIMVVCDSYYAVSIEHEEALKHMLNLI